MKCAAECATCAINSFNKVLIEHVKDEDERIKLMKTLMKHLSTFDFMQAPPEIHRLTTDLTRKLVDDAHKERKIEDNQKIMLLYDEFKDRINKSDDPIKAAVLIAICGNIIDYTPGHGLDMDAIINDSLESELTIDHLDELKQELKKAKKILYLFDNAGEIVTDKLLIGTLIEKDYIIPEQITGVVRGCPTLNDALMSDAIQVGMTDVIRVIDNGDTVPGCQLDRCSESFIKEFEEADLIISKGMGNFESLHGQKNKKMFFLLTSKCSHITKTIGVPLHSFICMGV